MPAYTRTGDDGSTGLFGGRRVPKSSARISAIGDCDELNSCIGLCRAANPKSKSDATFARLQELLFLAGADIATPMGVTPKSSRISASDVQWLEKQADEADAGLERLTNFILPGGSPQGAHLHHARTVCRRAERYVSALAESEETNPALLPFFNRLSSLLFVLARRANMDAGMPEIAWKP